MFRVQPRQRRDIRQLADIRRDLPRGDSGGGSASGDFGGELRARGEIQLCENVAQMCLHSPTRYVQPIADLRVGEPLGNQVGNR